MQANHVTRSFFLFLIVLFFAASPKELRATSTLPNSSRNSYEPKLAHDFDLRTAWVEGESDYGVGEKLHIDFELSDVLAVTHIEVYNGYAKNERIWQSNSRVKKMALYANDQLLGHLLPEDTYYQQRFEVGSLNGDEEGKLTFSFEILEIYPGSKYADVAISEINFDGTGDH